jgi:hypothetical protein
MSSRVSPAPSAVKVLRPGGPQPEETGQRDGREHGGLDGETRQRSDAAPDPVLDQPVAAEARGQRDGDPRRAAVVVGEHADGHGRDADGRPLRRRIRSPSTRTPSSTETSGLMKYPSEVSTTCPLFTAQMNTPQLMPSTTAAAASSSAWRGSTTGPPARRGRG